MSPRSRVLCVISPEYQAEFEAELTQLRHPDVELIIREDANQALGECSSLDVNVVIVGMEVGEMDGLEFLARLLSKNRSWTKPIVVLPSKSDKFPPVVHSRDLETGHSTADETDFDGIVRLVHGQPLAPEPEPEAAPAEDIGTQAPPALTVPSWPRRFLIPLVGMAVFVVLAAVGYAVYQSGAAPQAPSATPPPVLAEPTPAVNEPQAEQARQALSASIQGDEGQPEIGRARADDPPKAADDDKRVEDSESGDEAPSAPSATASAEAAPALTDPIILPVVFTRGSPQPSRADAARIEAIAQQLVTALEAAPAAQIEVGGHASAEGTTDYNQQLGRERAEATKRTLVRLGVPEARIRVKSYGAAEPIASNDTEAGRQRNRRVSLRLLR